MPPPLSVWNVAADLAGLVPEMYRTLQQARAVGVVRLNSA